MNHVLKEAPPERAANLAAYADPGVSLAPGLIAAIATFPFTRHVAQRTHGVPGERVKCEFTPAPFPCLIPPAYHGLSLAPWLWLADKRSLSAAWATSRSPDRYAE